MTTSNGPDLIEEFKGKLQELRRDHEAELNQVARDIGVTAHDLQSGRFRRKRAQEAQEAHETAQEYHRTQETVQRLTGALDSARLRLEKMHVPGCLRVGYDCPACEGLDELESY